MFLTSDCDSDCELCPSQVSSKAMVEEFLRGYDFQSLEALKAVIVNADCAVQQQQCHGALHLWCQKVH